MRLKQKLARLVNEGLPRPEIPRHAWSENQELRNRIKTTFTMPIADFCRRRAPFDYHHGLVLKMLKTDKKRLNNGVLVSHDTFYWLRDRKMEVPALWILRLAGPSKGSVTRNQVLQWLQDHHSLKAAETVRLWTKKWGFKDSPRTLTIAAASVKNVGEARATYTEAKVKYSLDAVSRRIIGNKLLEAVIGRDEPEAIWGFFRSLQKDVVTLQIMTAALIKSLALRKYRPALYELISTMQSARNITVDEKLQQSIDRLNRLPITASPPTSKSHLLKQ